MERRNVLILDYGKCVAIQRLYRNPLRISSSVMLNPDDKQRGREWL